MTAVSIYRDDVNDEPRYSAVTQAGNAHAAGRTPGEALDALTEQLGSEDSGPLVIVLQPRPQKVFTENQVNRVRELTNAAKQTALSPDQQAELEALVNAELAASAELAATLADAVGR